MSDTATAVGEKVWPLTLTSYEVAELTGISRSTIFKMIDKGIFPPSVDVNDARKWKLSHIQQWEKLLRHGRKIKRKPKQKVQVCTV